MFPNVNVEIKSTALFLTWEMRNVNDHYDKFGLAFFDATSSGRLM